jgi:hypothetical protein
MLESIIQKSKQQDKQVVLGELTTTEQWVDIYRRRNTKWMKHINNKLCLFKLLSV